MQVFNYLLGSLTRIFTTLQEVDDKLILYGFVAGFALNAVLASQMVYYWDSHASKSTPEHKLMGSGKAALKQPVRDVKAQAQDMKAQAQGQASGSEKRSSPSTRRRG